MVTNQNKEQFTLMSVFHETQSIVWYKVFWITDTDELLNSPTPTNYNLIQKPRCTGLGGGVGFLCRKCFSPSIVSSPVFRSFEIIMLSFRSEYNSFVAACVYRPPNSCTTQFLAFCLQLVPISSFVVT